MIKSVELGSFSKVPRNGEVCVKIECGEFSARTSYLRESNGRVQINERLVIDLDNEKEKEININVLAIDKNDLDQFEKDRLDAEEIGGAT